MLRGIAAVFDGMLLGDVGLVRVVRCHTEIQTKIASKGRI